MGQRKRLRPFILVDTIQTDRERETFSVTAPPLLLALSYEVIGKGVERAATPPPFSLVEPPKKVEPE